MALSNEDLLKELSAKPIMEVVELVKMLEEEWGVSAAAPVAVAAGPYLSLRLFAHSPVLASKKPRMPLKAYRRPLRKAWPRTKQKTLKSSLKRPELRLS
jgi:hypothetical protein